MWMVDLKKKKRKKKEKNPAFSNHQPLFTIKLNIKKLLKTFISYRLSNQGMRVFFFGQTLINNETFPPLLPLIGIRQGGPHKIISKGSVL